MSKINAKTLEARLNKAEGVYQKAIGDIEAIIIDYVDFDYTILYQSSDGFVLLNADTATLAPINSCLEVIQKGAILTKEIHKSLAI